MAKLTFHEILITSHRERAGFRATLDKQTTIITGKNRSGKSFLTKSIFSAFGAFPRKLPKEWKKISPYVLIKFSVNGIRHTVLHRNKEHIFFDENDIVIGKFRSKTSEMASFISSLFNCNITILNKNGPAAQVNPSFFFSPFYIDQDTGWGKPWSSFSEDLQQYSLQKIEAVDYYTGIITETYCNIKSEINKIKRQITSHETYIKALSDAFCNISKLLPDKLTLLNEDEISSALHLSISECNLLIKEKTKYITRISNLNNKLSDLYELQRITKRSLNEISEEHSLYNKQTLDNMITCPTCLAEYDTDISERFKIVSDEIRCREILDINSESIENIKIALTRMHDKLNTISSQLDDKLKFTKTITELGNINDIIATHSSNKLYILTEDILTKEHREHDFLRNSLLTHESELLSLRNKNKTERIAKHFNYIISTFLHELGFSPNDSISLPSFSGRINETGSSVPRMVLAYYFTIIHLIFEAKQAPICPTIIDALNQSDIDMQNIHKMVNFILNNHPRTGQLILSTGDTQTNTDNYHTIDLSTRGRLLLQRDYHDTWSSISFFANKVPSFEGRLVL